MKENIRIYFCDEISEGSYNRLNFIGYNPGPEISIPTERYLFISTLGIELNVLEEYIGKTIGFKVKIIYSDGEIGLFNNGDIYEIGKIITKSGVVGNFIFPNIKLLIERTGDLIIDVFMDNQEISSHTFNFVKGEGPLLNPNAHKSYPIDAGVVDPENNDSIPDIRQLLEIANKELIIIDQYFDVNSFKNLLTKVDREISIKIITQEDFESDYRSRKNELVSMGFKDVEVRTSNKIHDRFVVLNGCEYFIMGHSLKDIGSKWSSYFRLISKKDRILIDKMFTSVWEESLLSEVKIKF
ncbi:hypothetical protein [Rummeliibacillus pycnus]|uniref:hypothetical protein n=1 Tax=Rummeliibacillus pycnus TaxID=101070 RepID=UPI0037C95F15